MEDVIVVSSGQFGEANLDPPPKPSLRAAVVRRDSSVSQELPMATVRPRTAGFVQHATNNKFVWVVLDQHVMIQPVHVRGNLLGDTGKEYPAQ